VIFDRSARGGELVRSAGSANWANPRLASVYLEHFERNYRQSAVFQPAY
jgi:hypothetical protein